MTPEDLLRLPGGEQFELVAGRLVEKEMGFLASVISGELHRRLSNFVHEQGLGWTPAQECGYQCFPDDPRKVRKPDASFISFTRLPKEEAGEGWVRIPPDLAVEVVSPNDVYDDVQRKVEEYLSAGVRLVWVVSPANRTVAVYSGSAGHTYLHEADTLDGGEVLPGFVVRVGDLFPVRPAPPAELTGE